MNLYEMISSAQGGQALANLGSQFGLTEEQTSSAIRQLLPAFSSGLKRNTATPDGLGALFGAINDGRHERYFDDGNIFADAAVRDDGNNILAHVLGSKDVSRVVADRAAEQTGIGADLLKQMLPYVASLIMGALFKEGRGPLADILGGASGGTTGQPSDNPLGQLAEAILGGGEQGAPQSKPSVTDIFGTMLDADGDGSVMDDIFDMALGKQR
jgi:hypothetical protein